MPSKNKPKRLDRQKAWRVARRKKKIGLRVNGNSRNRQPRPKHKGRVVEVVKEVVKKVVKKPVEEKVVEKAEDKE